MFHTEPTVGPGGGEQPLFTLHWSVHLTSDLCSQFFFCGLTESPGSSASGFRLKLNSEAVVWAPVQRGGSHQQGSTCRTSLLLSKDTAEPSRPRCQETRRERLQRTWSSRRSSAGVSSGWTWFCGGGLRRGSRSAGDLQCQPSASPSQCSISAPTCAASTYAANMSVTIQEKQVKSSKI